MLNCPHLLHKTSFLGRLSYYQKLNNFLGTYGEIAFSKSAPQEVEETREKTNTMAHQIKKKMKKSCLLRRWLLSEKLMREIIGTMYQHKPDAS